MMMVSSNTTSLSPCVTAKFTELFSGNPIVINSPGRINLIGEHTDYNHGFVMPAAIDKGIRFAIAPGQGATSVIHSMKFGQSLQVDPSNPEKVASPSWANYLLGILFQLKEKGIAVPSFNCVCDGDLPTGAGLSSSAAMACGFAFALDQFLELKLSRRAMIDMGQWTEHHYAGVKCGIMDQFASMMGRQDHVILLDCQSLAYSYFPIDLRKHLLLLCDSGVKHSLASSEYNARRNECEHGVAILKDRYPSVQSLRDVSIAMVMNNKDILPEKVYQRCLYVTQENDRVLKAKEDLLAGRLLSFGEKMFKTHEGLATLYEVSCAELDFLVDQARTHTGVSGARMMGGGFGGCSLNIVEREAAPEFIRSTSNAYREAFGIELVTHTVSVTNGTSMVATD